MAEKYAIYAGEPLATVLSGFEDSRSARVNQVAAEWLAMVAALCPSLSEREWMATCDALLSTWVGDEQALKYSWAEIQEVEGLGEKWGIDQSRLVARIKALTYPELLAFREVLRRCKSGLGGHEMSHLLRQAGARVTEG